MPSLWNPADEANIRERIARLKADSHKKWGKMTVDQMMRHLAAAYNSAVGVVSLPDEGLMTVLASFAPARWFMINVMPWPRSLPTAKGFTIVDQQAFDSAKAELQQAFESFMLSKESHQFDKHPLFGRLSYEEWGKLLYKHTDHHLEQFGV
jgi:hypothetical protein